MKSLLFPCFSRDQFCGHNRRPGRRMKPPIVHFQGQTYLFTCPVLDAYKYTTFSFSKGQFSDSKNPKLQRETLERKSIKNSFLYTQNHSHMHSNIIQHFLAQLGCLLAWVLLNTHPLVCSSLISSKFSVLFIKEISYIICMLLKYILDTKQRLLC